MTDSLRATRLAYVDELLGSLDLPGGTLRVTRGLGSGLARRAGDAVERVWAIGDRGPNLKLPFAIERYGLEQLRRHAGLAGAKLMPFPGIGPAISELHVSDGRVACVRTIPLRDRSGRPLSGLPVPGPFSEPAFDLAAARLAPDPSGADTEGIAAAADGSFWIADEYGPSLLHVAEDGTVLARHVPRGSGAAFAGADYAVVESLPAIAAHRQLNRGFEALALSVDGTRLYCAFQSPLAHPDEAAHRRARHVRLWVIDTATGAVTAEFLYRLDKPGSFRRDSAIGDVDRADLKLCDIAVIAPGRLLVLERGSATAKLYAVTLDETGALDPNERDIATRPTIEQRSAAGDSLPALAKTLIFSTDDHAEIGADLEGIALLSPRTLLLVNDNDFGVDGVATQFWHIDLPDGTKLE
ncbi:esterase-like activity of phytase family protein [Sphingomonas sp. ZT3P38]|uniref:esterase-like activity of phytase family protein n=1 Tax=Parasphingomonas zepuensis TaxID=3096161 RepID=UPI002FC63D4B